MSGTARKQVCIIGLGKMGQGIARRLSGAGYTVVGYDADSEVRRSVEQMGIAVTESVVEAAAAVDSPRVVWLMVPAGETTQAVISDLLDQLSRGDVLIDGGNSNYRDSRRHATELARRGISFLDVGTSGGVAGEQRGYCLMIGGAEDAVKTAADIFDALAFHGRSGWTHVGPNGAGHFVKMIHNGIEYGMMQALAEGFALLDAKSELDLDPAKIAELWRNGSIVSSTLLDHVSTALGSDASLSDIPPHVSDSGEGRWTVAEAIDLDIPAPVITLALLQRFQSRMDDSYADRLLAAMRLGFGGHQPKLH